jgi:hypothetical protein
MTFRFVICFQFIRNCFPRSVTNYFWTKLLYDLPCLAAHCQSSSYDTMVRINVFNPCLALLHACDDLVKTRDYSLLRLLI